jgi:hypothetical protein
MRMMRITSQIDVSQSGSTASPHTARQVVMRPTIGHAPGGTKVIAGQFPDHLHVSMMIMKRVDETTDRHGTHPQGKLIIEVEGTIIVIIFIIEIDRVIGHLRGSTSVATLAVTDIDRPPIGTSTVVMSARITIVIRVVGETAGLRVITAVDMMTARITIVIRVIAVVKLLLIANVAMIVKVGVVEHLHRSLAVRNANMR